MQKAFHLIEEYRMIEAKDKIIVGVSGGADSLCLLFVLLDYCRRVPCSLLAVHVEHGIRGEESRKDAQFVEELCGRHGVECRVVSCCVPELAAREGLTVEEAGRRARYEAFERIRRETGAQKIAVAHNRDDLAETVLFHIVRGSGLDGAGGIPPVRGNIIRPLLSCSREEIEGYLCALGASWCTDATNMELSYTRNRIRRQVIPLLSEQVNAAAAVHLAAFGEEMRLVGRYLFKTARERTDAVAVCTQGEARISVPLFLQEDAALQPLCLRECLSRAGCGLKNITRAQIGSVRALFFAQSGRRVSLPGGWTALRQFDTVLIRADAAGEAKPLYAQVTPPGTCRLAGADFRFRVFPYKNENILQKTYTKWFDYDRIKKSLVIRTRQPGDYLVIGRQGQRKKLKQYLIEEKIPADERSRVLLLADGCEILWVVGHRISEAYKVTAMTKNVLEVQKTGGYDGGESDGNVIGNRS